MITVEGLNWKFNQAEYKVKAGEPITITYKNKEGVHGIIIKDLNVDLTNGKSVSVTAEKGTYEIICSIPCGGSKQHTEMRAMLIVE
jgi:cytochrome c oxidase subunit 2